MGGRRSEIVSESAALFAAHGIARTTIRDIGEAAGVHPGSIYHHFASKDAIALELLTQYVDEIRSRFADVARSEEEPECVLRGLIAATLQVIEDHPHPTAIYQNDRQYLRDRGLLEPVDTAARALRGYWMAAIDAGVARGDFRATVPPEMFYRSVRDTLWSTRHWPRRSRFTVAELSDLVAELFLTGFRSSDAPR